MDARGRLLQETLRNRNTINNATNAATGWLLKTESWDKDLNIIQQTRYEFDPVGNVEVRERFRPWIVTPDGNFHAADSEEVTERFTYDSLDRLLTETLTRDDVEESAKVNGYDDLGNLAYKGNMANPYSYTGCMAGSRAAGPHAVCAANGTNFTYDANGNLVSSAGTKTRTIDYSAFNKPVQITEGGTTVEFVYGADRSRIFKRATTADGTTKITWYVGLGGDGQPIYEQTATLDAGGQIVKREHLHFVYAGGYHKGQPFAVHVLDETEDNNATTPNPLWDGGTEYYHRDHLGSVIAITGDSGEVKDTRLLSFDAWGKRRNENWSEGQIDPDEPPVDQYTPEGMQGNLAYTGHEAVPEVGLIHMNGRVYDPELGRILTGDIFVQAPFYSQSFNRYSYAFNNALRYVDPSGYISDDISEQHVDLPNITVTASWSEYMFFSGIQNQLFNSFDFIGTIPMPSLPELPSFEGGDYVGQTAGVVGDSQENSSGTNWAYWASAGTNAAGLMSGVGENSLLSTRTGANGWWKGSNGRWYPPTWEGTSLSGYKSSLTTAIKTLERAGVGLFAVGAAYSTYQAGGNIVQGNWGGVGKNSADIAIGYMGAFGGWPGLITAGSYYAIDYTVGIETFSGPVTDGLCSTTGNC